MAQVYKKAAGKQFDSVITSCSKTKGAYMEIETDMLIENIPSVLDIKVIRGSIHSPCFVKKVYLKLI